MTSVVVAASEWAGHVPIGPALALFGTRPSETEQHRKLQLKAAQWRFCFEWVGVVYLASAKVQLVT